MKKGTIQVGNGKTTLSGNLKNLVIISKGADGFILDNAQNSVVFGSPKSQPTLFKRLKMLYELWKIL